MSTTSGKAAALLTYIGLQCYSLASAQRATVYYDHRPGQSDAEGRISFQTSEDKGEERRHGTPPRLQVPQGSSACVVVENANPVLYTYSLSSKTLTVEAPADLGKIAAALNVLLGFAKARGFAANPKDTLQPAFYYQLVAGLIDDLVAMKSTEMSSDTAAALAAVLRRIDTLYLRADSSNNRATNIRSKLSPQAPESPVPLVAAEQEDAWNAIVALRKRFIDAAAKASDPLCAKIDDKVLRITLSIKPALDTGKVFSPRRPIGDSVVTFEAQPVSNVAFEVAVGGLVSTLTSEQSRFAVENGVVVQRSDRTPIFKTTIFALGRAWRGSWLRGAIGASVDDKGASALFFGLAGKFGVAIVGPELSLGVGLSLARVPVGLTQGSVGMPLPSSVSDVNKVVSTALRPGLGVSFTLTGVQFGGNAKK